MRIQWGRGQNALLQFGDKTPSSCCGSFFCDLILGIVSFVHTCHLDFHDFNVLFLTFQFPSYKLFLFWLDGIKLCLPTWQNKMYWFPKKNRPVAATWNFMKASKVRKKVWWRKWRPSSGGCCQPGTDTSQPVRAPPAPRKPSFPTHRAFFLEVPRSCRRPGSAPLRGRENSHRTVIMGTAG